MPAMRRSTGGSARGGQTTELTTRRARLALEAGETGLARSLARTLPAEQAAPLLQWAALIERPGPEVTALHRGTGAGR